MAKLRIVRVDGKYRIQRKIIGVWLMYRTFLVPMEFTSIADAEECICATFNRKSINDPSPRNTFAVVKEIHV